MSTQRKSPTTRTTPTIKCLSDPELNTLLAGIPIFWHKAMITILADTGLRVAELCGLVVADLWMLNAPVNTLAVRHSIAKNKKSRTIPLTPRCVLSIRDLHQHYWTHDYQYNFQPAFRSALTAYPIGPRHIQRIVDYYGRSILYKHLTPHMLRHTFATRLMTRCPISVVQQLLGHSNLSSTQIYTHPSHVDLQNAIDALNSSTGSSTTPQSTPYQAQPDKNQTPH